MRKVCIHQRDSGHFRRIQRNLDRLLQLVVDALGVVNNQIRVVVGKRLKQKTGLNALLAVIVFQLIVSALVIERAEIRGLVGREERLNLVVGKLRERLPVVVRREFGDAHEALAVVFGKVDARLGHYLGDRNQTYN